MKTFVIAVLVCAFVVYSQQEAKEDFAQKMKENRENCLKDTKAKPELADKALEGEFAEDKDLKCYVKCMFVKFGYMSDAGEFNYDFIKAHPRPGVDPTKAAAAIDKCKSPTGDDACEKSFNFAKCAHTEVKA